MTIPKTTEKVSRQAPLFRRCSRGSLSVETALLLPVFLVAMLSLGIIIRMVSISENLTHALTDEIGITAADGIIPVRAATFSGDLTKRVEKENGDNISSPSVTPFLYRVPYYSAKSGKMYRDLIAAEITSDVNIGFPNMFGLSPKVSVSALCRAFVGTSRTGNPMSLDELEKGGDPHTVWVFPRAGAKYHTENCSVIKNSPREVPLSSKVRSSYSPCELCKPGGASNGSLVYVFSGKAFHLGSCFIVERFTISMSKGDAKAKGYTACAKCGGGG